MTKKQKTMLYRIILAAIVYIPLFVMDHKEMLEFDTQVPVRFLLFMIPICYNRMGYHIPCHQKYQPWAGI